MDPDRGEPAGTQYKTFFSRTLGAEVSYLLYLPPEYGSEAGKRYPVIYWLHGLGGDAAPARGFSSAARRGNQKPARRRPRSSCW